MSEPNDNDNYYGGDKGYDKGYDRGYSNEYSGSYRGSYRGYRGRGGRGGPRGGFQSNGGAYRGRGSSRYAPYRDDSRGPPRRDENSWGPRDEGTGGNNVDAEAATAYPSNPESNDTYRGYRGNTSTYRGGSYAAKSGSVSGHSYSQSGAPSGSAPLRSGPPNGQQNGPPNPHSTHRPYDLKKFREKSFSSSTKTYDNPWIETLSIRDEKTKETLENRYKQLETVNQDIIRLQMSKRRLETVFSGLDKSLLREQLHVQLTSEKLEDFTYL